MVLSMDERLLDAAFLKGRSLFCSQTSRCAAASLLPAHHVVPSGLPPHSPEAILRTFFSPCQTRQNFLPSPYGKTGSAAQG